MEKLYYENTYQKDFTAEILNVVEKDNKYHVELDKTCFYPEGGGQPCDIGYIDSLPVKEVYEENGIIYHVVTKKPLKIHRVKCSIDWDKRYDNMQQHLGQHILSSCFAKLYNANTIGFHLGDDYCTIDIDKFIGNDAMNNAENMANKIILDNINVDILFPSTQELKKMSLSKAPPKTNEQIRIVKVGDVDAMPCCGTHPNSTIEVQLIKVIRWEKYKSGIRIEFICGKRAVSDYVSKHESIMKMSNMLSCNENDLLFKVEKLSDELNTAIAENRSLKNEVAQYEVQNILNSCESINNVRILKSVYDNSDLKYIGLLATKLTAFPNVIVLFGVKTLDKAQLIFMCSKDLKFISMNTLLKDAITLIDGKGGGSEYSAQGGGKNNNNVDSCLDYAYMKVKNLLCLK